MATDVTEQARVVALKKRACINGLILLNPWNMPIGIPIPDSIVTMEGILSVKARLIRVNGN